MTDSTHALSITRGRRLRRSAEAWPATSRRPPPGRTSRRFAASTKCAWHAVLWRARAAPRAPVGAPRRRPARDRDPPAAHGDPRDRPAAAHEPVPRRHPVFPCLPRHLDVTRPTHVCGMDFTGISMVRGLVPLAAAPDSAMPAAAIANPAGRLPPLACPPGGDVRLPRVAPVASIFASQRLPRPPIPTACPVLLAFTAWPRSSSRRSPSWRAARKCCCRTFTTAMLLPCRRLTTGAGRATQPGCVSRARRPSRVFQVGRPFHARPVLTTGRTSTIAVTATAWPVPRP